jgi:hypothetical protein
VVDGETGMTIHGLTVCVDYAEFLSVGIFRWLDGLASLTIVTSPHDEETMALARVDPKVQIVVTDLFYRDGAAFNKGRAMEAARLEMPWTDWILFFDADVVPPDDWGRQIADINPYPQALHGAYRFEGDRDHLDDRGQPPCAYDVPGVGYFQLFHSTDPRVQTAPGEPLIDVCWTHAGNYDNRFMDRWRAEGIRVRPLPFRLAHIGERENWFGRGKREDFLAMQAERRRRGGRWDHETLGGTE